jgi:phosphoribosylpyrophosphate synthetase
MQFLKSQGAGKVISSISLPLFSGDAIAYFDAAYKEGLFSVSSGPTPSTRKRYCGVNGISA